MDTGIQVQLWNILKYFLLTLILAPIAEGAMGRITAWRNANLVSNQGKSIRLKSSVLGNIALHQEVETMHLSSRFWQLFSVLLALAIALPFEYSSGAQLHTTWSHQRSLSTALATDGSDELMLLALDDPRQSECVDPKKLANVGEYIFLQPREDKPQLLNGIVTFEDIDNLIFDTELNWIQTHLTSRNGDRDLRLYAGGRGGQQALIWNPDKSGLLIADFETGSLCKGFIDETFSCYDMAGQLTLSQLAYSLAAVSGGSMFLRTRFEKAAKIYRFNAGMISNSVGDPSKAQNLIEQGFNESGFEWLSRHRLEGEDHSFSITTLGLDTQLQPTLCQSLGAVQIRPLRLQFGNPLIGEKVNVSVSPDGDLRLVKGGTRLQIVFLTQVGNDLNCAVDEVWGVCVSATNGSFYFMKKAEDVHEYSTEFKLPMMQPMESHADLAALEVHIRYDISRNGYVASWDIKHLLPSFGTPPEGARAITRRNDTSVAVSSGVHLTGTIKAWAVALYGCLLLLFLLVLVFSRITTFAGIDIHRMYRSIVWQKETAFDSSEKPDTAPIIGIAATQVDGVGGLTASYKSMWEEPMEWPQDQPREGGDFES